MSPVRAVLFDAGHTLLEFDYPAFTARIRACGYDVCEGAVTDAERRARARLDEERAADAVRERRGVGRYLQYVLEQLGITSDDDRRAIAEWRRSFNPPIGLCHRADPEAVAALQRLQRAGVAIGVISNSNGTVRTALDRAGLGPYLHFVIDSTVVGVAKPDPRVFKLGLAEANVEPGEAVYVGDSYFVDVIGARSVGMNAVLFDPSGVCTTRECRRATGLRTAAALALCATRD